MRGGDPCPESLNYGGSQGGVELTHLLITPFSSRRCPVNELDSVSEGLGPSVAGLTLLGTVGDSPHPRTLFSFSSLEGCGETS